MGHRVAVGQFEDPENARVIYLAAGGLLLLAAVLGLGTWWWWRTAKVEHPVLGPLEVMSSRRFAKADFTDRQRQVEAVRLADAASAEDGAASAAIPVDLDQVLEREDPPHFDDLAEPAELEPTVAPAIEAPVVEPVAELPAVEPAIDVAVVEPAVEVAVEPAVDPVVEVAVDPVEELPVEPVQLSMPIVVIDTAPPLVVPEVAEMPESLPPPSADDTPSHFDPLLRPRSE